MSLSVTENHVVTAAGSADAYSDKVRAGDGVFKPIVYNSTVASDGNQANDMTVSIRHSLNGYTINSRYYECSCGATNNAKIKSTLTVDGVSKDKLTVGFEAYEKYYTDTSDTYLGVGDPFGGR